MSFMDNGHDQSPARVKITLPFPANLTPISQPISRFGRTVAGYVIWQRYTFRPPGTFAAALVRWAMTKTLPDLPPRLKELARELAKALRQARRDLPANP